MLMYSLNKVNNTMYYCTQSSGATRCDAYTPYMIRQNSDTTASWIRIPFNSGNYNVTNVTIRITDCDVRYNKVGSPSFGIGTTIDDWPGSMDTPSVSWSASDTTNSTSEGGGYNCYSVTMNVNLQAHTTYQLYLYTYGTAAVAWQCLAHPYNSSDSRTTKIDIIYNTYEEVPNAYTVSLSKDSGISSVSGAGTYNEGTYVTVSATPASGYNFVNWTGTTTSTSSSFGFYIYENRSYTANSSRITYTVSYDKGTYGTGTNSSMTKNHGSNITLKAAQFTRTGYTQTGWATDAAGTNYAYNVSGTYSANANITLYPYWEPNVYKLTINPNGGSMYNGDSKTTSSFTTDFAYGTKTYMGNLTSSQGYYPDNTPTRTGYQCNGFTFSGGTGQLNTGGATFYFMGEHPGAAGGTASSTNTWIFNGDYNGAVTATAKWTANTYYVSYNSNGGTGSMSTSTHTYGTASTLTKNTFSRAGYAFGGWNTRADGSGTSYNDQHSISTLTSTNGETIQLYAIWSSNAYTIVFDMNGGSTTSANFGPMTCTIGTTYTLPTGTITKSGYTFKGWSTSSSATSATYAAGASIKDIGSAGQTVTLYAVWTSKSIKIKYNANNGGTTSSTTTYTASSTSNKFATLNSSWTKSGYNAVGWSTSSTATSPDYQFGQAFSGDLGLADGGTLNLYVVWVEDQPWTLALLETYRSSAWSIF